ncbi:Hypothetical protein NTJ_08534 [Nesidiocoris tenuis]|uniref:MARVEL domain-containing protein n=1 Tax=Nesidiocoris tenuis TaxID=355587 RepID=A0ABN7AWH2_9HEMI|nr:Hypothetical protein NTJ_08534 [Nesidiocoris tenuis]
MSTENIKKMSEQTMEPKLLQDSLKAASPILIKILELVIGALCVCLIFVPFDNNLQRNIHRSGVVCIAFAQILIVNTVALICHFQRSPLPKIGLCIFSFVAGVFLVTAGSILVADWWMFIRSLQFHPPKMFLDLMLSCGIFSYFLAIISFVDIYVTRKFY